MLAMATETSTKFCYRNQILQRIGRSEQIRLPLPCCKSQKMSKVLVGLKVTCLSQIQLLVLTVSLFLENQGQLPILTPKLLSILTALRIVDILAWIHTPSNSTMLKSVIKHFIFSVYFNKYTFLHLILLITFDRVEISQKALFYVHQLIESFPVI